ncbi:MAG: alkyl hydroperoxide reductase subunit C [Oscillospiraceae bacterium]|nr:alkyl hydroperoxide reductase subunit C [Oscillospiraceae bacterium]MDD4367584.1 alkyl hydroperoxide reductase subunit C [Oscillospiraceae bacterium]
MSLIHKKVAPFSVHAYQNDQFIDVTEQDLLGHWSVMVFYPADFTFVCPTELGDLAENYEAFKKINCEVYSVSTDSHFTHKAWHDESDTVRQVQYPMLGDPGAVLARDFEVLVEKDWQALRGSFVINPEGEIVAYEVNDTSIGRDSSELLRKVEAAQFVAENGDQVCPARWKPGQKTLKPGYDLVGKI